jgi:hypothetical protein
LGGIDEEHFRLVHVAIEARAIPAVAAMLRYAETRYVCILWKARDFFHT